MIQDYRRGIENRLNLVNDKIQTYANIKCKFVIARFIVTFNINTTGDASKRLQRSVSQLAVQSVGKLAIIIAVIIIIIIIIIIRRRRRR